MTRDDLTDEMVMAYADGELDEASARRVEMALSADPALARRIAGFGRSRRLARAAFAAEGATPVPEALRAAVERDIRAAMAEDAAPAAAVVVSLADRRRAGARGTAGGPRLAAAAAVLALIVGGLAGYAAGLSRTPADADLIAGLAGPEGAAALGRIGTGDRAPIAGGSLRVIQTVRTQGGDLCREVAIEGDRPASAVVCHAGGGWQVRFVAIAPAPADGYAPADGTGLADGWFAAVGAGPMLEPAEETAALEALR